MCHADTSSFFMPQHILREKKLYSCRIEFEMFYLCIPWKNLSYIYWDAVLLCLLRDILRPLKS